MRTITYAAHVAHFDPMTGQGLLVMPTPEHDLFCGTPSLHESGWDAVVHHLASLGIEPQEDDNDGSAQYVGSTADGREVLALYGPSLIGQPTMGELALAFDQLAGLAGIGG